MKRVLSILLILALVLTMSVGTSFAESNVTFVATANKAIVNAGEEVTITIKVTGLNETNNLGGCGFNLSIPGDFEYVSHEIPDADGFNMINYNAETASFTAAAAKTAITSENWIVMTLTLRAKSTATSGEKTISFINGVIVVPSAFKFLKSL